MVSKTERAYRNVLSHYKTPDNAVFEVPCLFFATIQLRA